MTFEEKLSAALSLLESKGIMRSHYAPIISRLLWRAGVKIPPPHFADFLTNFLVLGGFMIVICLALSFIMRLLEWIQEPMPITSAFLSIMMIGTAFGSVMAISYSYSARKHAIPRWSGFLDRDRTQAS